MVDIKPMRISLFLLPFLLSLSFAKPHNTKDTDPGLDSFIQTFMEATLDKNQARLMSLMDPGYRMEQHDKFHKGNTTRFLDELFCGSVVGENGFKCIKLKKVKNIEVASVGEGEVSVPIVFRVSDKKTSVDVILTIKIREQDGRKKYGIVGAVG